jgi:ankyrin repeat protein|tara:strand:- start:1767 stop:2168 length:402 start_codon:yes stop_codon:yes gene_type:complete
MGGSNNTSRACNINEKNAYDRSVLHKAAYYSGSATLLENLITQGADVNARDKGACTPLHLAAKNGHVEALQILLENGANMHVKDIKHGWTPLHIAIVSKQYESAKFLIRAGSSVSECDKWGNSAQKLFELSGI